MKDQAAENDHIDAVPPSGGDPWSRRVRPQSRPNEVRGLVKSVISDMKFRNIRYEYAEAMLRSTPGFFGKYLRYKILTRYFKQAGKNIVIWPGNRFRYPEMIELGDDVVFSFNGLFQGSGGLTIGSGTGFGPDVKVWTVDHLFNDIDKPIFTQGYEVNPVAIGSDCWITSCVFIKAGTIIPDGCVVLPCSVVGRMKIPPYSVIGGNPAKVLGPRNRFGAFMTWKQDGARVVEASQDSRCQ